MNPVKTAGNGFADPSPPVDAAGITAQAFAESLFKFEYCNACLCDVDEHTFVIGPTGNWFALCDGTHQVRSIVDALIQLEKTASKINAMIHACNPIPQEAWSTLYSDCAFARAALSLRQNSSTKNKS